MIFWLKSQAYIVNDVNALNDGTQNNASIYTQPCTLTLTHKILAELPIFFHEWP